MAKKETPSQKAKMKTVMGEFKRGTLHDGPDKYGHKTKSRPQAIATAMHEAGIPKKSSSKKGKK